MIIANLCSVPHFFTVLALYMTVYPLERDVYVTGMRQYRQGTGAYR